MDSRHISCRIWDVITRRHHMMIINHVAHAIMWQKFQNPTNTYAIFIILLTPQCFLNVYLFATTTAIFIWTKKDSNLTWKRTGDFSTFRRTNKNYINLDKKFHILYWNFELYVPATMSGCLTFRLSEKVGKFYAQKKLWKLTKNTQKFSGWYPRKENARNKSFTLLLTIFEK